MKFLFDFLFTVLISFENNLKNTTPLEVNIGTGQKKAKLKNQNKFSTLVSNATLWIPFLNYFYMGRRNNHNENKISYL